MNHDHKSERDTRRRVELAVAIGQQQFDRDTVKELLAIIRNEGDRLNSVAFDLKRICRRDADIREAHEVVATWQPIFAREGHMLDNVREQLDEWQDQEVDDGT